MSVYFIHSFGHWSILRFGNPSQPAFTCSKLTIETLKQDVNDVVLVSLFFNFENISHLILVFLLLTLNMQLPTGFALICNHEENLFGRMKKTNQNWAEPVNFWYLLWRDIWTPASKVDFRRGDWGLDCLDNLHLIFRLR